ARRALSSPGRDRRARAPSTPPGPPRRPWRTAPCTSTARSTCRPRSHPAGPATADAPAARPPPRRPAAPGSPRCRRAGRGRWWAAARAPGRWRAPAARCAGSPAHDKRTKRAFRAWRSRCDPRGHRCDPRGRKRACTSRGVRTHREVRTEKGAEVSYSVGQVAGFAGVTVRTLHHYDDIGLLVPSERSPAGHRRYSDADLDRLQQILFYRELGFPLEEVAALLDDPDADPRAHLRRQHELLTARIEKLRKMAAA